VGPNKNYVWFIVIWRFPKMGVPPVIIRFFSGLSTRNYSFWGFPIHRIRHRPPSASRPELRRTMAVPSDIFAQEKVRNGALWSFLTSTFYDFWWTFQALTGWYQKDMKRRGAWAESKCCGHGALWGESRMAVGLWTSRFWVWVKDLSGTTKSSN